MSVVNRNVFPFNAKDNACTCLRQDPDIILVGEIKDAETAQIAVKAALTGHLVLSTLHTNDAPSTVNRLLNMGVEGFMLAFALRGILAQHLVRTLFPACKQPAAADRAGCKEFGPGCPRYGWNTRYGWMRRVSSKRVQRPDWGL
jgi:type II secretory ATPase GspE/PulE/Tfp pilus assembly ATPase PilB-like protein